MKPLERVRNLIAGKPVDHLPAQPMLMMFAARHAGLKYLEYARDPVKLAHAQLQLAEDFSIDCLLTSSDPTREVSGIAGEGSIEWLEEQGPAVNEDRAALLDPTRLATFAVPDPHRPGRMYERIQSIEILRRHARDDASVVGWIEGPLSLAAELRGINHLMTDFTDDPAFVSDLFDFTAATAIAYADAQIAAGADTIGMGDAAACMIGPELYSRVLFPRQLRIIAHIRAHHPHVLTRLHMCGQTGPLLPQMRLLNAHIYELDFPVNVAQARAALGPNLVISGNVSTIAELLTGTPDDVYRAAQHCHETAGRFFIVNSGCDVSPFTPPDNLRALIRYAHDHQPLL